MSFNNIVVVGSCMIDFTSYVKNLPKEGETIHGSKFVAAFGGKGANQCVAAAKLGGRTTFIARVGDDIWGEKYIKKLIEFNINTNFIQITPNTNTGVAQINVSDSGANQIVIVAAANENLNVNDVEKAKLIISKAAAVICQLETSVDVAIKSLELCNGISILNGAPALYNCDPKLFTLPTFFCVNETEATTFTGIVIDTIIDANKAVEVLLKKGCRNVILTLGEKGALAASKEDPVPKHITTKTVKCLDSTGAGDEFVGALAYLLVNHKELPLEECIKISNYLAADSVTKCGTQLSFPDSKVLESYFLQN